MPRTTTELKVGTFTFRIDAALKSAFNEVAAAEAKPPGELLRELVRERVERQRRRDFEAEARRQSQEAAAAARDPDSDEAQVLRELDANFEEFAREWK